MTLPTPNPEHRSMHPAKRAALVRRTEVGWQNQALCRKFPNDDWFPVPATSEVVAELVDVCRQCPVQRSCLAAALAMGEEHGIWGGTTEADRANGRDSLARGASVPDVLDQLTGKPQPTDVENRGEAA